MTLKFYFEIILIFILATCLIVITIKNIKYLSKKFIVVRNVQNIHDSYIPPLGGVIIYFCLFLGLLISKPNSFLLNFYILAPSLLILVVGLIEDLYSNIKPILRFIVIFICSLIFSYFYSESLPNIDINFIQFIFNRFPWIEILIYTLGLTALANGFNMIDGMNGLAGFNILSIITGLGSLLLLYGNFTQFEIELIYIFIVTFVFLIFNFPHGKIFLGDSGAYAIGWILGVVVITIFSNSTYNTWTAVLIIFYPLFEVIFSTIRKLFNKQNPLFPDSNHVHLKIYKILKGKEKRSNKFNSFCTLTLMPLWFSPNILLVWTYFYAHLALIAISIMVCVYIYYYYAIPNIEDLN